MLVGFEKYNRKNFFFTSIPRDYFDNVIARAFLFLPKAISSQRHRDCFAAEVQERRLAMTAEQLPFHAIGFRVFWNMLIHFIQWKPLQSLKH